MAVTLPTPETDTDAVGYGITLAGVQIRYRLRWWPRIRGWYVRFETAAGALLSDWHRVNPEALCVYDTTVPGMPAGILYAAGVGNADLRDALWDDLELQFEATT